MDIEKIKTKTLLPVGTIVEMDKKFYEVVHSRKLIPFLDKISGFVASLKEVEQKKD